ncbi:MAG: hypothetical protein V4531_00950 [Actinomycetota bacterium]
MQWWTDFLDWLNSDAGWRIVSTAVIPFAAIIVAGIVAAAIGRASARKVIELSEREVRASAVTALISAARKAAVWNTLPAPEQQHIDHLIGDAEIRLRLLPIAGTALAADWARHEIAGMKRNAISFSFQAEQSLLVFRDRLIEWQGRPSRAKKLFKNDLDSWAYDSSSSEQELVHQQQKWAAQQVTETGPIATVTTTPFTRPPSPAPIQAALVESSTAAAAASVAAANAPAASDPAVSEIVPAQVQDAVLPEPVAPNAVAQVTPASVPIEPSFSSPEAAVLAGDERHSLVEPVDTSSHDVSEASIFGGTPPQDAGEPEHTEPVHSDTQASEPEIIEGEIVEPDAEHDSQSDDAGATENVNENQHAEHEHTAHDHQHNEWRG